MKITLPHYYRISPRNSYFAEINYLISVRAKQKRINRCIRMFMIMKPYIMGRFICFIPKFT